MNYIQNAINTLTPWWTSITFMAYTLGIVLFLLAMYSAINNSKERNSGNYMWLFLASVLCLNLPALLNSISFSVFNTKSANDLLAYTSGAEHGGEYITFSIRAVMLIGLVGVLRGINYLRDTPQRSKDMPKALTHTIGGTLAVNIVQLFQALGATAGGDVKSYIDIIL